MLEVNAAAVGLIMIIVWELWESAWDLADIQLNPTEIQYIRLFVGYFFVCLFILKCQVAYVT